MTYKCFWTAQSGSQLVEGSRVVKAASIAQAIAMAHAEVATITGLPKGRITVDTAILMGPTAIAR